MDLTLAVWSGMKRILIACSTWGEGEQPDNAEALFQRGEGRWQNSLKHSFLRLCTWRYILRILCQSGKEWDEVLETMGGTRIHDRVDCDVDYDAPAAGCSKHCLESLVSMTVEHSTKNWLNKWCSTLRVMLPIWSQWRRCNGCHTGNSTRSHRIPLRCEFW